MPEIDETPVATLINEVEQVAEHHDSVTLGQVLDHVKHHSFAGILLLIGLAMLVPGPADIPGVPTLLGILVVIVATQMLFGREHVWIPASMEKKRLRRDHVQKIITWGRKPAHWLDRITKRRCTWLVNRAGTAVIAIACIFVALSTPILEFIPFSGNLAGAAITAFSLALMAKDGLLAALAIGLALTTAGLILSQVGEVVG